ncbi:V-snare-domain-containing protein [Umbelopsis sp. PMI_123]|nr:V-snare-domain-containing protein [Umbelopsis sp. PMI_123]
MIRTTRSSSNPPSPSLVPLMTTSIQDEEQDLSSLLPSQPSVSWDSLRKQARQLENEVETKLASLTKSGSNLRRKGAPESSGTSVEEVTDLEYETEELLKRLQTVITSMSEFLERPSATPNNPSMLHMLQRHKDIAFDYNKELRKVKASIRAAKDKADLLTQVRDEIRTFHNGGSTSDYMLTERNKIENSHRMTDMVLDQAYATRDDLGRQRNMLRGVNSRIGGVLGRLPGINNLISRINTRRKRDTVIMALVISMCTILIMLYWLRT